MNKVILLGNLTKGIEVVYKNEKAIGKTSIAVNRKFGDKEEVLFIDLVMFGKTAEFADKYLGRGSKILIEGRLRFDQWVDGGGIKHSKHSVIVDKIELCGGVKKEQKELANNETSAVRELPEDIDEENIPF